MKKVQEAMDGVEVVEVECPCTHAIQLPEVATNAPRQHQVLVSPAPTGCLTATRPRQTFEGHRRQLRQSIGSEVLQESDHPGARDSLRLMCSLEAREREDSVGLLSPPSSQQTPRASLLGSRNGSATSLARISGAFRSRSHSRNTSSGSGPGSGGSS
jgi:hypothetical protein